MTARRGRRRLRLVLPFAVLVAFVGGTLLVHAVEQPDPTDSSFLSPVSSTGDGADRLAARLAQRGIAVDRRSTTMEALEATRRGGDSTLFVTTPGLVHPEYLELLPLLPGSTRIVLVAPTAATLEDADLRVPVDGARWTATAPDPGCTETVALTAGPAAVRRLWFGPTPAEQFRCYDGGLVEVDRGNTTVTLVGAADPFRNDRLADHGNEAFAVGLLARSPRVVWLDLHEREAAPPVDQGGESPEPTPVDSGEPLPATPDEVPPEYLDETDRGGDQNQGGAPSEGAGNPLTDNPLARAFPPALWATVLLVIAAALALAAASARRLGAPVAEPLPARVHATETVLGHARLYQRARARGPSLYTLRTTALARIAEQLGMPPDSTVDDVSVRTAAHTGRTPVQVRTILGGGAPETDEELVAAATAVQNLVRDVLEPEPLVNEGDRS